MRRYEDYQSGFCSMKYIYGSKYRSHNKSKLKSFKEKDISLKKERRFKRQLKEIYLQ